MNRLQQSGLIALFLLLAIAGAGSFLGRGKVTDASIERSAVTLEPGSEVLEIDLYSRQERLSSLDFERGPRPGPLDPRSRGGAAEGGGGEGGLKVHRLDPDREVPPAPPAPPVQRRIQVRQGDSLQRIAGRELGDSKLWRLVATTNGLRDPFVIQAGQELLMPTEAALARSREALEPQPASAAGGRAEPAPASGERRHRVARGETLGEISQQYYGTSKHSMHILRANGLSDPRELRANATIVIPPPPR